MKWTSKIYSTLLIIAVLLSVTGCNKKVQHGLEEKEMPPPFPIYNESTLVNFIETDSIYRVFDLAQKENKLTLLEFYTDWCLPCQIMDETVYQNKIVSRFLNENFVNYKINAEKLNGPTLGFLYQVKQYPTFLFLNSKGRIIKRHNGSLNQTELMLISEEAMRLFHIPDTE